MWKKELILHCGDWQQVTAEEVEDCNLALESEHRVPASHFKFERLPDKIPSNIWSKMDEFEESYEIPQLMGGIDQFQINATLDNHDCFNRKQH